MSRSISSIFIALGVVSAIIGSTHYYIWARLVRDLNWGEPWRTLGAVVIGTLAVSMPVTLVVARRMDASSARPLMAVSFVWMGLFFMFFCLLVGADAARLFFYLGRLITGTELTFNPEKRLTLLRLVGATVTTLAFGGGAAALGRALSGPDVTPVSVTLKKLPKALDGFTIVQISDLHVAPLLGRDYVAKVVERANAQNADLIAITGDLVDGSVQNLRASAAPLAGLKARYGVFFVTGNHEYYSGAGEWIAELVRLGIRPLQNERVSIEHQGASLDLAGVDDITAWVYDDNNQPKNLHQALAGRDTQKPVVLMAHQPKVVFGAAELEVDLMLAGHTHGGQIWPFGYLVRLAQPYLEGLAQHGPTAIYVNRGTGYWGPPMRLGAPPEVTLLTLKSPA